MIAELGRPKLIRPQPTSQLGEYDVDDEEDDSDSDMENAVEDDEFDAVEDDGTRTRRQSDVDMDH